jgi:hypothetical protein
MKKHGEVDDNAVYGLLPNNASYFFMGIWYLKYSSESSTLSYLAKFLQVLWRVHRIWDNGEILSSRHSNVAKTNHEN